MNRPNHLLFYPFMLMVVLAPLPLGSNREWSWTLCALLIAAIGLVSMLLHLASPSRIPRLPNPFLMLGFLLVCGWALLQTSASIPEGWAHPLWAMASETAGIGALAGNVTLSPDDTFTATMRLLSYGLVFFLAFQWGRDRELAHRAFSWFVLAGFAYAVYGLAAYWSGSGALLWFEDPTNGSSLRATFVNRNHYATYAGLALICAMALFYHRVALHGSHSAPVPGGRRLPPGARVISRSEQLERFALQVWKPLVIILLLTTALILTHSRAGFFSTFVAAAVLLVCFNFRRRIRSGRSFVVIALAATFAFIAFWLTSEVLLDRMDRTNLDAQGRFTTYEVVRESTQDNPLLGFGYGSFADSFRLYRTDAIEGYFDRAHNTYLENAFELGWPAAVLLFTVIAVCLLICLHGLRDRGRDWIFPATGIAATVLVAVHAWFDFSLQMPAVAIGYACIMGVACAQSFSSIERAD